MARAWEIVGRAYPNYNQFGEVESTTVTLTSNTDGYAIFTETLPGDVTAKSSAELIKLARDQYFKKEYSEYAMEEAVLKVDLLEKSLKESAKLQNELEESLKNIKDTAETTDKELKLAESKRNTVFENIAKQINEYDEKIENMFATINGFMEEVFVMLESQSEEVTTDDKSTEGSTELDNGSVPENMGHDSEHGKDAVDENTGV